MGAIGEQLTPIRPPARPVTIPKGPVLDVRLLTCERERVYIKLTKYEGYEPYIMSALATLDRPSVTLAAASGSTSTSCSFAASHIHRRGDGKSNEGEKEDEEQAVDASEHDDFV